MPAREVVQLRGPKFPGREIQHRPARVNFIELWGSQPNSRYVVEENGDQVFSLLVDQHPDYSFDFNLTMRDAGEFRSDGMPWSYRLKVTAIRKHDEDWNAYWAGDDGVRNEFTEYDSGFVEVGPDDENGFRFQVWRGLTSEFNLNGIATLDVNGPSEILLTNF